MITPKHRTYRRKSIKRKHNELDELRRELLLLRSKVEKIERNKHGGSLGATENVLTTRTPDDPLKSLDYNKAKPVADAPVADAPLKSLDYNKAKPVADAPVAAAPAVDKVHSEFDLIEMNTATQEKEMTYLESLIDNMIRRIAVTTQQPPILIEAPFLLEKMGFELIKIFNMYFKAFTNPELQAEILKIVDPSMVAKVMTPLKERLPGYINKVIEAKILHWIRHPETPQNLKEVLIQLFHQFMPQESKGMKGGFSQDDCF